MSTTETTTLDLREPGQLAAPNDGQVMIAGIPVQLARMGPDEIGQMMTLHERWEATQAKKTYFAAISDFQSRCPIIEKADKAYDKLYARMDRIWRTIRPIMSDLGLSVTWQMVEYRDGMCHVEGELAQREGHSVRLIRDVPVPELIKGQNKTQQAGSAETYAKRYALCAALGIVTGEDDDGGKPPRPECLSADDIREIESLLNRLPFGGKDALQGILEWASVTKLEDVPATWHKEAIRILKRKVAEVEK
jgi:hypothetical protein